MKERGKAEYIDRGEEEVDGERKMKGNIDGRRDTRGEQLIGEKLEKRKELKERLKAVHLDRGKD